MYIVVLNLKQDTHIAFIGAVLIFYGKETGFIIFFRLKNRKIFLKVYFVLHTWEMDWVLT